MSTVPHDDRLIVALDAPTLSGAGSVSHQEATARAESEYEKYRSLLAEPPDAVEEAYLKSIKQAQREVEGETT